MEQWYYSIRVELELIVTITNLNKYISINSTCIVSSEKLLNGLTRSSTKFLLNTNVIEIRLDEKKIKVKMKYLKKIVIIAYFVKECLPTKMVQD